MHHHWHHRYRRNHPPSPAVSRLASRRVDPRRSRAPSRLHSHRTYPRRNHPLNQAASRQMSHPLFRQPNQAASRAVLHQSCHLRCHPKSRHLGQPLLRLFHHPEPQLKIAPSSFLIVAMADCGHLTHVNVCVSHRIARMQKTVDALKEAAQQITRRPCLLISRQLLGLAGALHARPPRTSLMKFMQSMQAKKTVARRSSQVMLVAFEDLHLFKNFSTIFSSSWLM